MDPFSAMIGAGGSLLSGLLGQQNVQSQIDAQMQMAKNRIQYTVADAKKAGINPLAALGNATQSYSAVVDNPMGQGIERAAKALASGPTRSQLLEDKLTEAKIANVNSDTVRNQAAASSIRVNTLAPGSPPAIPLPRAAPGYVSTLDPLMKDFRGRHGEVVTLLSPEAAQTQFGAGSNVATALPIAVGLTRENIGNAGEAVLPGTAAAPSPDPRYYTPF